MDWPLAVFNMLSILVFHLCCCIYNKTAIEGLVLILLSYIIIKYVTHMMVRQCVV